MSSEALEVRWVSRACAALVGLIVATLISSLRLPVAPATGPGDDFSMQIVRKRAEEAVATVPSASAPADLGAQRATASLIDAGAGMDVRLWLNGPAGEIVFMSAERYARCIDARARRRDDADCPSASDRRRMVLDATDANRA